MAMAQTTHTHGDRDTGTHAGADTGNGQRFYGMRHVTETETETKTKTGNGNGNALVIKSGIMEFAAVN